MIKFSIITCTYNAANELPGTLESVLNQNYLPVEHLIIDGASTDHSMELVHDYQVRSIEMENGHDIIVSSEPDKGLYDAMNKGIERATGDYVVFLNAGDVFPAMVTFPEHAVLVHGSSCATVPCGGFPEW